MGATYAGPDDAPPSASLSSAGSARAFCEAGVCGVWWLMAAGGEHPCRGACAAAVLLHTGDVCFRVVCTHCVGGKRSANR